MSRLALVAERDLDTVSFVVDVIERAAGQPWRIALDELDDARRHDNAPRRFAAIIGAVQRVLGGRARNAKLAKATRALALGAPVFTAADREARIAATAEALELTSADVERLLWSDLPRERPVELPFGRPTELEIAAFANVQLLQRVMCRAHGVTLRIWGDAGTVIRAAGARGLLTTARVSGDGETVLEIVGPLALCHRTSVYGRALAQLVPLLADCARWRVELQGSYSVECESPALLPRVAARAVATNPVVLRLARALRRDKHEVITTPVPLVVGSELVCPDLAIGIGGPASGGLGLGAGEIGDGGVGRSGSSRTRYVELVGFWTATYLERKLARYAAGGFDVRLCIDETRCCTDDLPPEDPRIVRYAKRVDVASLLDE